MFEEVKGYLDNLFSKEYGEYLGLLEERVF